VKRKWTFYWPLRAVARLLGAEPQVSRPATGESLRSLCWLQPPPHPFRSTNEIEYESQLKNGKKSKRKCDRRDPFRSAERRKKNEDIRRTVSLSRVGTEGDTNISQDVS